MTRLLLTGASGQTGRECLRLAPARGFDLLTPSRSELDLEVPDLSGEQLMRLAPDAVLNCAAFTAVDAAEGEPERAFRINADAPRALGEAARRLGVPMVHISTDYVFDGTKTGAYVETDPIAPLGVYGRSKAEGEAGLLASGARAAIVRTSWVYSPHRSNFVKTMLRLAETREEIGVVDDQWGRPTSAADLADASLGLVTRLLSGEDLASGIFHYAGAGDTCWAGFAEAVFEGSAQRGGPLARVRRIPTSEYPTPARRPANSRLDTSKIEAIGIGVRPWRDQLATCLDELVGPPSIRTGI